jgi:ubiquinone/menaquinone biosynthesis C-methylase UbiE
MKTRQFYEFYALGGLDVAVYDVFFAGRTEDVEFYVNIARETGGPVLDLGCGTGRVLTRIAREGISVVGVDSSDAMLANARRKVQRLPAAVRGLTDLRKGDMRNVDVGDKFAAVVIPFRSFQNLLTVEDQDACLGTAARHLVDEGRLALDIQDPIFELCTPGEVHPEGWRVDVPAGGGGERFQGELIRKVNDPIAQVSSERWLFKQVSGAGDCVEEQECELRTRWIWRWEMFHLLRCSGFEIDSCYSGFAREAPKYGCEQVWVGRKSTK